MTGIETFLAAHGPTLSSNVAKYLIDTEGVTAVAARKRIQRAGGNILKLRGIRFPQKEQFLYLKRQYRQDSFWEGLVKAFKDTGASYGPAVSALKSQGGLVPKIRFDVISGMPSRLKKHLSSDLALTHLQAIGILKLAVIEGFGECIQLHSDFYPTDTISHIRARHIAEGILLAALSQWLRENGLVSHNAIKTRDVSQVPEFGPFRWDLTAPSYLLPFREQREEKSLCGFVVADVALVNATHAAIEYFVRKCATLQAMRSTRPFIPFMVVNSFSLDALAEGRKLGLVFTTMRNLLGERVADGLNELLDTLTNAAAAVQKNPEIVQTLFSRLGKIEGAASNLRGPLFELVVGHCVSKVEGGWVEIGQQIEDPSTGARAQIDVLLDKRIQINVYECKGKLAPSKVDGDDVRDWLETKVPRVFNWIRAQKKYRECKVAFHFWTTGEFTSDTLSYMAERAKALQRYSLDWKSGSDVRKYVQDSDAPYMLDVLSEHYFKNAAIVIDSTR